MCLHDQFVEDINALCVAVIHEGVIYYGSVVDTHYHIFAALDARVVDADCGFVDCKGNYYSRTEAAAWLKANWPELWRRLDDRSRLESMDYALAAMLPKKGITLEAGPAPNWALSVSVRQKTS